MSTNWYRHTVVALLLTGSACRHVAAPVTIGVAQPVAYPSGDAADVYRTVVAYLAGTNKAPKNIAVLFGETVGTGMGYNPRSEWTKRAARLHLDSTLVEDVIAENQTSIKIDPGFFTPGRLVILSSADMKALDERGKTLEEEARRNHSPYDLGFWMAFHEKYPNAPGTITLSRIGFNKSHTEAALYYVYACGGLCADGGFMILRKKDDRWEIAVKQTEWVS